MVVIGVASIMLRICILKRVIIRRLNIVSSMELLIWSQEQVSESGSERESVYVCVCMHSMCACVCVCVCDYLM